MKISQRFPSIFEEHVANISKVPNILAGNLMHSLVHFHEQQKSATLLGSPNRCPFLMAVRHLVFPRGSGEASRKKAGDGCSHFHFLVQKREVVK